MRIQILLVGVASVFVSALVSVSASAVSVSRYTQGGVRAQRLTTEATDILPSKKPCSTVDFRKEIPPIRFQGDTNFCFAYATAVIVTQRTGVDVSALDLAATFFFARPELLEKNPHPDLLKYLRQNPRWRDEIEAVRRDSDIDESQSTTGETVRRPYFQDIAGGVEDITVLLSNGTGLCTEADFPSDQGFKEHQTKITELLQTAEAGGSTPTEMDGVFPKFRDPIADIYNTGWMNYMKSRCKRVRPTSPILPVRYFAANSFEEYLNRKASGVIDAKSEARELFKVINYALDIHRTPAVGYSLFTFSPRDPNDPDLFADHSSAVIARKKAGQQCYYLIRDNSGVKCNEYSKKYDRRCKNSEFWVTEDELSESLYSVVYLP